MSSAVAFLNGKQIVAYIGTDGRIYVNGGAISGSNAKSGLGLAVDPESERKVITYTNTSGALCKYEQTKGSNAWGWVDTGWDAK